jgi:hypothetical protein
MQAAFAGLLMSAALLVLPAGDAVEAATACLAAPNSNVRQAGHWYYRYDRVKDRKCWYFRLADGTIIDVPDSGQQAAAADDEKPAPKPRSEQATAPKPRLSAPVAIAPDETKAETRATRPEPHAAQTAAVSPNPPPALKLNERAPGAEEATSAANVAMPPQDVRTTTIVRTVPIAAVTAPSVKAQVTTPPAAEPAPAPAAPAAPAAATPSPADQAAAAPEPAKATSDQPEVTNSIAPQPSARLSNVRFEAVLALLGGALTLAGILTHGLIKRRNRWRPGPDVLLAREQMAWSDSLPYEHAAPGLGAPAQQEEYVGETPELRDASRDIEDALRELMRALEMPGDQTMNPLRPARRSAVY